MIYVDRNRIPIPPIFHSKEIELAQRSLEEFYSGRKSSRSQKRYRKQFEPEIRKPIIKALRELFRRKCAYCESRVSEKITSTYDHFRPKFGARGLGSEFSDEHYWWLTYEWKNFYYSCQKCNQYKASWFPVDGNRARVRSHYSTIISIEKNMLIDPCNESPRTHFSFNNDGEIMPLTEKGGITIDILKLNRNDLLMSRKKVLQGVYGTWELLLKLWNDKESNWKQLKQIGSKWSLLLEEQSQQPFVAASKQLIEDRLKHYPDIKDFFNKRLFESEITTKTFTLRDTVIEETEELSTTDDPVFIEKQTDGRFLVSNPIIDTKQVYIESLELKNFKCFDELKIEFPLISSEEALEKQPWLLFLGENGVGKSSILKAIAIAFMNKEYQSKLQDHLSVQKLLKYGKRVGFIKLKYNGGEEIKIRFDKLTNSVNIDESQPPTNLMGYGSVRLLPKVTKGIQPEKGSFSGIKVENLFDYTTSVQDADKWLLKRNRDQFNRAAIALKDLMQLKSDDFIERDKKAKEIYILDSKKSKTSIDELSDGYKTIYALAVDIMATLSSEEITYDLVEGIVLIDEIGTHLHPRWKMQVVESLRSAFPKLQFIVTTHEPLCLRGLYKDETIVLARNEENKIVSISDLPDPSELRIDQILTSEFFGLKSTFDPKTEQDFNNYYRILAKESGDRTNEEKAELLRLQKIIPRAKHLGDSLREELAYYVIDELLAQKVKKKGLKLDESIKEEAKSRVKSLWESINEE